MTTELKPCPCCGESRSFGENKDGFYGIEAGTDSSDTQRVICYSCGLRMIVQYPDYSSKDFEEMRTMTREEAIRKWNRRT